MMSSAETLNFGPQWLRDLSEGSNNSSNQPTLQSASVTKFKLAENRYGREEMLALFVDDSEVPEELHRAPSLVSEIVQPPLAFRPSDHSQGQLSASYRGRGMPSGLRGRSIPNRGRGRGRGTAWADPDDGPLRRPPLLRRSESEDWRSDSLRGKGDGAEDIMGGMKEWRIAGHGQRQDFWKDAWRDRPEEPKEQRTPRGRSLSSRDAEDSDRRWREDDFDMFPAKSKASEPRDGSPNHGKQPGRRKDTDVQGELEASPKHNGEEQLAVTSKSPSGDAKPPDSQSSGGERRTSLLDPVPEVKESAEPGRDRTFEQNMTNSNTDPNQNSKNALEEMFQRLAMNDSAGGSVNASLPQLQHTAQKSDPVTSTVQIENHSSASSIGAFSSNSPFGDIPVTSNSPIAQLQALATTWFYKDPQGDVQGPFSSTQMMEWFNAGYFTMDLLVKRACDTDFTPLGELIKTCGHIPFSSQPKNPFPNTQAQLPSTGISVLQQYAQQREVLFNMKLLDGKQQSQPSSQVPTQVIQQPVAGRTFQNQPDFQVILSNLMKNPEFLRMSPQQRQQVVRKYAEEFKRQAMATEATRAGPFQPTPTSDGPGVIGSNINGQVQPQPDVLLQQKLLEEARRKEEEEIRRIKRQQEEQKELLRKQEEEFRRKKEMLLREEEEIKQLQLEAQRKREELQRNLEEEKMKKIQEMQELERKRKQEEEERRRLKEEQERREAEQRRIQEEEEKRRREEERIRQEMEEAIRLEQQRQEEMKRLEIEREEKRMLEEIRKREEMEKQAAREAELQRKAEAARILREKEAEAKALLKKQQQEKQMQQIQLPSHARWGHNQPSRSYNESLSLVEIQKLEKEEELTRLKEEARMARENRTQAPKPKTGWGAPTQEAYGVSLLDIQREEAKQMSVTKQSAKPEKIPANLSATSWSKPPKIQPDVQKPKPAHPQASFWDQVVEENPKKPTPQTQKQSKQQPKQVKQQKGAKQKVKSDEGQHIKALFQQQISKDSFTDWCEKYLAKMNVGSIDIPTFVNFLRDVESSYEVQEYVQSYLGESREAKDFTTLFLEQRAKLTGNQYQTSQSGTSGNAKTAAARDTDGFEIVTSNTKRGKKKLKKLQKVDPSILGFSVNAASDRVNMGEIQNADN